MPDLIAQGVEPEQRWRRALPEGQEIVLGRSSGAWGVAWDYKISRRHAVLLWNGSRLEVSRLAEAQNPIFFRGQQVGRFSLRPGEHFIIGRTMFTLVDQQADVSADSPTPLQQQLFSTQYLRQVHFQNPDHRLEVLNRLPEVISGANNDVELFIRLVSMLLAGIQRANAVAVVAIDEDDAEAEETSCRKDAGSASSRPPVRVLHWDQRQLTAAGFRPSRRLIMEAVREGQSLLHIWRGATMDTPQDYTVAEGFDWAFCTPVRGEACRGWGLYVAGRFNAESDGPPALVEIADLREDVKFAELVAAMLAALRQMRLLERRQAVLSQFFSPVVLEVLAAEDPEVVLSPRETEVVVMFCDLRGFSSASERQAGDLLGWLRHVSRALSTITHQIRAAGGVVGDLQGDAAMGFWGWPLPQPDAVLRACRAALAVQTDCQAAAGFQVGIGIAAGPAVAGKIGTGDQMKVTVFGPVVNLAARLENMTRLFRAPILLDEAAAEVVRCEVSPPARLRRLATVRPYGLETPLEVSELLPPVVERPTLSDEHLRTYEAALDAFRAGSWQTALELLHRLPAEDQAKDFLMVYIACHNRRPPPHWDGVISLDEK